MTDTPNEGPKARQYWCSRTIMEKRCHTVQTSHADTRWYPQDAYAQLQRELGNLSAALQEGVDNCCKHTEELAEAKRQVEETGAAHEHWKKTQFENLRLRTLLKECGAALGLRMTHDMYCADMYDKFEPYESCECGATVAIQAYAKVQAETGAYPGNDSAYNESKDGK